MIDRPADGHAGDLVSAHLDGELDPATDAWVADHLAGCERCGEAAQDLRAARSWVRSLPAVDAAPVVEGLLARHRYLVRTGAIFVGVVSVALGALAVTSSVVHPQVVPDVEGFAAAHVATAHDALPGVRPVDDVGNGYAAPSAMPVESTTLSRREVFDGQDITSVVYRGDGVAVSVYQQPGRVDWDRLPEGDRSRMGDRPIWIDRNQPFVVVTEVGHLAVTVVSEDRTAALSVAGGLPEERRTSTWQRVHDACQRVTEVFAFGG